MAAFDGKIYKLIDGDQFERVPLPDGANEEYCLEDFSNTLGSYVENKLCSEYGFIKVPLLIAPNIRVSIDDDARDASVAKEKMGAFDVEDQHQKEPIDRPTEVYPEQEEGATTSILASPNWTNAENLLIIVNNAVGSQVGIWSRSLCIQNGLRVGTLIPYIEKALAAEPPFGVLLLRPNTNSFRQAIVQPAGGATASNNADVSTMRESGGESAKGIKVLIKGSESPESHVLSVWENILPCAINCRHIALLGYGNGASLCHDLYTKSILSKDLNIVHSFVTIEASQIIQEDDSADIRSELGNMAINFEHSQDFSLGVELAYRRPKLGITTLSVGLPAGSSEISNVAVSASLAVDHVFSYLSQSYEIWLAENREATSVTPSEEDFVKSDQPAPTVSLENKSSIAVAFSKFFASQAYLLGEARIALVAPPTRNSCSVREVSRPTIDSGKEAATTVPKNSRRGSIFNFFFGRKLTLDNEDGESAAVKSKTDAKDNSLCVEDFDLLKVVGQGAFGKVILVRKKSGHNALRVYAMKVLKKTNVIAGSQVEHTLAERAILLEVKQPYIVHLRYAFQNKEKLYLLTDYYNGGSLFMHLSNAKHFSYERTTFYAAEIISALDYLHKKNIIYRDLKLENIMMDHRGHLALIDFGLSKHHFDHTGATTFCGTAYYIAPEVLKGKRYGFEVDYWSLGVLIYEMIRGRTPFQDSNKKLTFMRILKGRPTFNTDYFNPAAIELVSGLLRVDSKQRLGYKKEGAQELMNLSFFSSIDWGEISRKGVSPPWVPELSGPDDTKYIGKNFERMDPKRETEVHADVLLAAEKKALKQSKETDSIMFANFAFAGAGDSISSKG